MRRLTKLKLGLFSAILLLSLSGHAKETIRLTNGEWLPFLSESLEHNGILSHIVSEAFDQVGIEVEYGFFPWKRAMYVAQQEEWEGSIGWVKTPERLENFYFSESIYHNTTVFFSLKETGFDWYPSEKLAGQTIGVLEGTFIEGEMKKLKESGVDLTYQPVTTDLQNFKKLKTGRIDALMTNKQVGLYIINNDFPAESESEFSIHPNPYNSSDLHLILDRTSSQGKEHIEKFNQGLMKLKKSGRLQQMWEDFRLGKYGTIVNK
ncbi:substrate-binding periplasmic protein [Vibrio sp. HN007]|uniref:substrate-binding periplasmic protein n=1 Tax=Vibrio iocasae TaxID=3098914 RepID=UPI0035D4AD64